MTWADIKADWSTGFNYLWSEAQDKWKALVEKDPSAYRAKVEGFLAELQASRRNLDALKAKLPSPPKTEADRALVARYQSLEKQYHDLAAGFYSGTEAVKGQAQVAGGAFGAIPLLIVAGLAVSAAAAAWAVPGYEYAVNLREQTSLANKELDARVSASKEGRLLQSTTLPAPPPSPLEQATGKGIAMVGIAAAIGVGFLVIPRLMR